MQRLELWGGPECTLNRVGDVYRDQLRESGHDRRLSDLDLFAELGLAAIRYPVLWEQVAPDRPDLSDWRWADARLLRLRELGVRPIVGLVHHGSGPRYTDLLSDDFATGLAAHARALAERHPWIDAWTPVNEPLTTARFSALYGHWYPHHRDERSFWRALINQIDGIRLSMAAVRGVIPHAQLIQTDDLGRTYATAAMRDQAAFDNVRRWMGWDLLCGHVVPGHCFWKRLVGFGFEERLRAIADAPSPPDIVGVNHYLTSDRYLDHRVRRYPRHLSGDHPHTAFVDTEAVRVLEPSSQGLRGALGEAWTRYGIPLAVTEIHNGCTREEQMRWTAEAWRDAEALRGEGVDVRAVTAWALLGSFGWDTLLTDRGRYEPGAYDLSGGAPRPTATAALLRSLARGAEPPLLCGDEGWWRRPLRFQHAPVPRPAPMRDRPGARCRPKPVLALCGAIGGLVAEHCDLRGLGYVRVDPARLEKELDRIEPWAVLADRPDPALLAVCSVRGIVFAAMGVDDGDIGSRLERLVDEITNRRGDTYPINELIKAG